MHPRRSLTPEGAAALGATPMASVLDVCANADIVSLHVAANKDTKGLANRAFFEAMRPGALFINTTRGSVVDEEALKWALDHKGIRAGLGQTRHLCSAGQLRGVGNRPHPPCHSATPLPEYALTVAHTPVRKSSRTHTTAGRDFVRGQFRGWGRNFPTNLGYFLLLGLCSWVGVGGRCLRVPPQREGGFQVDSGKPTPKPLLLLFFVSLMSLCCSKFGPPKVSHN